MWRKWFGLSPLFIENVKVAFRSIKSNSLRSTLTVAIIAIGIMSLVGILTATEALRFSVTDSFSKMGAGSFSITSKYSRSTSAERMRIKNKLNISYSEAEAFVRYYQVKALTTVYCKISSTVTIKSSTTKTNQYMALIAADENYLQFNQTKAESGRNINSRDLENGSFVCLIGNNVSKTLFGKKEAVGEVVSVKGVRYEVIGVIDRVGESFGGSLDNSMVVPISNARASFIGEDARFVIGVLPEKGVDGQYAMDEAEKVFRQIRRLSPFDETDFMLSQSDFILKQLEDIMKVITIAALIIGIVTLIGAAVGLMNIMLVSVKERTREIGTRKALGATANRIHQQFLLESIIIGQLGGIVGIIMGVLSGNLTAVIMKAHFVMPWIWIGAAVVVCLIVSILSGFLPARRAASLDPIEALRYE